MQSWRRRHWAISLPGRVITSWRSRHPTTRKECLDRKQIRWDKEPVAGLVNNPWSLIGSCSTFQYEFWPVKESTKKRLYLLICPYGEPWGFGRRAIYSVKQRLDTGMEPMVFWDAREVRGGGIISHKALIPMGEWCGWERYQKQLWNTTGGEKRKRYSRFRKRQEERFRTWWGIQNVKM